MLVPAAIGAPISAGLPSEPMEKMEIVPAAPFDMYKKLALGETSMNCGVDGTGKGEPEISVKSPRAGSMLKTEMLIEPWLRTKRNCPPALTPSVTGFVPTRVGVIAVPIGASTPEVWSKEYPDTVLEVELAT